MKAFKRLMALLIAVTIVTAALSLAGCADTIMRHPTKTAIKQDNYECMIVAEQRAAAWSGSYGANPFLVKDFLFDCLEARGWQVVKS